MAENARAVRDSRALAGFIDHTILKAEAGRAEVARYCAEAREHGFASVCVNAVHAGFVADELASSPVRACVVVGFPLGAGEA